MFIIIAVVLIIINLKDVIFYKFLSLAQLYSLYISTFTSFSCVYNNLLSIIIIISRDILHIYLVQMDVILVLN